MELSCHYIRAEPSQAPLWPPAQTVQSHNLTMVNVTLIACDNTGLSYLPPDGFQLLQKTEVKQSPWTGGDWQDRSGTASVLRPSV